ncbi:MAG: hypothetical protein Q7P63_04510 [Verrucomicrobiota bacterium JB022]|nr:hypothetical protein [Verrucomicrobiota bacterium JB022]
MDPLHISFDDICLVGEYVTPDGPFADDWFLLLGDRAGSVIDVSSESELWEQVRTELRLRGIPCNLELHNKVEIENVVHYPPSLQGRELFLYTPLPAQGIAGKLQALFHIKPSWYERTMAPWVVAYLQREGIPDWQRWQSYYKENP